MSLFGRRMSPEILAAELLHGLESGEVVFDGPDAPADDPAADRVAALVETALVPARAQLQTVAEHAAAMLKQAESDRREAAETLGQARAVLAEVAWVVAHLRDGSNGKPSDELSDSSAGFSRGDAFSKPGG